MHVSDRKEPDLYTTEDSLIHKRVQTSKEVAIFVLFTAVIKLQKWWRNRTHISSTSQKAMGGVPYNIGPFLVLFREIIQMLSILWI